MGPHVKNGAILLLDGGYMLSNDVRKGVGLWPKTPHIKDGILTEPPISDPMPMTEAADAKRAASPPEEPPEILSRS